MRTVFIFLLLIQGITAISQCQIDRFLDATDESTPGGRRLSDAIYEEPSLVESWEILDDLEIEEIIKNDPNWLIRTNSWKNGGVQFSNNNTNLLLTDAGGSNLGELINGRLLPEKYDFVNGGPRPGGRPSGDVVNGYQVYDHGGDLSIRRVPDKEPYNASEITELTQHPNAHVLERHGHDVTDEALIKRSRSPSYAPDGKRANNAPPYSSKFESPEKLKEALTNTKPGSAIFDPPANANSYAFDYPPDHQPSPDPFGYGIPSGGDLSSRVQMYRVKVVYRKVGSEWQLLTMFPQP